MLNKNFDPKDFEATIYQEWLLEKTSTVDPEYSIIMPPPNVTGTLHLGHALNNTLQDIMVRFMRQKGKRVYWQPGLDHAGIATQIVVEKKIAPKKRQDLGRDQFVKEVWDWRNQSGDIILGQMRRLGVVPDWDKTMFTLDEPASKAVCKAFVDLYNQGLVYQDYRLVNWDPTMQTALSDLEVIMKPIKGKLYRIAYPVLDSNQELIIATTRPETMFGDMALAVHPDDERYKDLVGKTAVIPIAGREISIIADSSVEMDFGTGVVKITPAHDFSDFEMGKRHKLALFNILNADGSLNNNVPLPLQNMSCKEAREKISELLQDSLKQVEDYEHMVPHGERSGAVLEPYLTTQWFLNTKSMAEKALHAVENGKSVFIPAKWKNTYDQWLKNIQPWCLSRQLWWGHQIPAWYGSDKRIFVAHSEQEAQEMADKYYGHRVEITQDPDVLDTWFSAALWPMTTQGWPDKNPPTTSLLITGFDIIFFWVARMMMFSLHFTGRVPFKDIYIHALVRDEYGQKMSKSKGNIIDPLQIIDDYGADTLRLTLAALSIPGRDIKLNPQQMLGYRNFVTKIWNAARFLEVNGCVYDPNATASNDLDHWAIKHVFDLSNVVEQHIVNYRFDEAINAAYHGTYLFCDYYLEFLKVLWKSNPDASKFVAANVFVGLLKIWHPFIPFVTSYLAKHITGKDIADWRFIESEIPQQINTVITLIQKVRSFQKILGVEINLANLEDDLKGSILKQVLKLNPDVDGIRVNFKIAKETYQLVLPQDIDQELLKEKLSKEISNKESQLFALEKKLADDKMRLNAPIEVIQQWQDAASILREEIDELKREFKE